MNDQIREKILDKIAKISFGDVVRPLECAKELDTETSNVYRLTEELTWGTFPNNEYKLHSFLEMWCPKCKHFKQEYYNAF